MSLLVSLLLCCSPAGGLPDTGPSPAGALLTPDHWRPATPAEDPWADMTPAGAECPSWAWGPEGAYFEVETDVCPWGTWTQPIAGDVTAGDRLEFTFYHLDLWAPEPAEAVVTLHLDHRLVWELRRAVPSSAAVESVVLEAAGDMPEGSVAAFHVHNHGANSYRIGRVARSQD